MESNQRVLKIFSSLYSGKSLSLEKTATYYQVSKRTIQRDLATIKTVLSENWPSLSLTYNHDQQSYGLEALDQVKPQEILLLSKILLESRSLNKVELTLILDHLLNGLSVPSKKSIQRLLANELLDYYPLHHQTDLLQLIWDFNHYILEQTAILFDYQKNRGEIVHRIGLPVSLFFSEYYFYALLYNPQNAGYRIYRLDRFKRIQPSEQKIKVPYNQRIQDSELRKKLYFMYAGKEVTFTFRFWGIVEAALDKLPQASIIAHHSDESVTIQATAYDTGIVMWLLSQGSNVQVLSPPSFVKKVKTELKKMNARYSEN